MPSSKTNEFAARQKANATARVDADVAASDRAFDNDISIMFPLSIASLISGIHS